jgi:hypothetical protein
MTTENNNRIYWDQLNETNPALTKEFNKFGKTLTTIDPQYQIMKMTEIFGPVGKGWSYDCEYSISEKCVFAEVTIRWKSLATIANWFKYGPICSVQALFKKNGSLDDEAPKKAMTDALTKGFSHLGMSADVFMGKFDNDKYVQELKEKYSGNMNKDKIKVVK